MKIMSEKKGNLLTKATNVIFSSYDEDDDFDDHATIGVEY